MEEEVKKEVEKIIKFYALSCSVEEFRNTANWRNVSLAATFSEDFAREFRDNIIWGTIIFDDFSEVFLTEFKNKVCWGRLVGYRNDLSENFIYNMREEMGEHCFKYCLQEGMITKEYIKKRSVKVDRYKIMDFDD